MSSEKFGELVNYHLGDVKHFPSGQLIACEQAFLVFASLASFLYAFPAADYHNDKTLSALDVVGTVFTGFAVLYVATDTFYKIHVQRQRVKLRLKGIVEPPLTPQEYTYQNITIGFCAMLSAIPMETVAVAYPLDAPTPVYAIYLAYILFANTILHFLPIQLVLNDPWYGTPTRLLAQAIRSALVGLRLFLPDIVTSRLLSSPNIRPAANFVKYMLGMDKDDQQLAALQCRGVQAGALIGQIANAREHFFNRLIALTGDIDRGMLRAYLNKSTAMERLQYVLSFESPSLIPIFQRPGYRAACACGILIVYSSCIGYLANPYLVFKNWVDDIAVAILCSALPMYFMSVLLVFFGEMVGKQQFSFWSDWSEGLAFKIPFEMKLYPVTMSLCALVNLSLIWFASAAANEMMEYTLSPVLHSAMITFLQVMVTLGIGLVGWTAPVDFELFLLRYVGQYLETGEKQKIFEINAQLKAIEMDIGRLVADAMPAENKGGLNVESARLGKVKAGMYSMPKKTQYERVGNDDAYADVASPFNKEMSKHV